MSEDVKKTVEMPEVQAKKDQTTEELRFRIEKELLALLAHPLIPNEFKAVFEEGQ